MSYQTGVHVTKASEICFCPQKDPWAACSAAMRNVLCLLHIFTYCWASPLVIDSVKFLLPDDFNILLTDNVGHHACGAGGTRAHEGTHRFNFPCLKALMASQGFQSKPNRNRFISTKTKTFQRLQVFVLKQLQNHIFSSQMQRRLEIPATIFFPF